MGNNILIYTKLSSLAEFDQIQEFIYKLFELTGQYYDTKTALKIRLELEHFLEHHGKLDWHKIRHTKRTVEEPFGTIEQGVFSHKV